MMVESSKAYVLKWVCVFSCLIWKNICWKLLLSLCSAYKSGAEKKSVHVIQEYRDHCNTHFISDLNLQHYFRSLFCSPVFHPFFRCYTSFLNAYFSNRISKISKQIPMDYWVCKMLKLVTLIETQFQKSLCKVRQSWK